MGEICIEVQNWDVATKNGWHTTVSGGPTAARWYGNVINYNDYTIIQYLFHYIQGMAMRSFSDGTWGPWEWVNPPMSVGVEYRTVERYIGKPVYVKLVDCGEMPSAKSEKVVHACEENTVQIIRCHGIINSGDSLPGVYGYLGGSVSKNTLNFRGSTLYISALSDFPSIGITSNAKVVVWYYKIDD